MYSSSVSPETPGTECINPCTNETIGYAPVQNDEEVARCFRLARSARESWRQTPLKERVACIQKIKDHMMARLDHLSETVAADNGKTRFEALSTEILPGIAALSYYCRKAKPFLKDKSLGSGAMLFMNKRSKIQRVPYGVIGIISPWNYPFAIPFSEVIMALLAGNCVILKAASKTQMTGLALKECIEAAGLPDGVFSYVNMAGSMASQAFFENGVDKLFFTGSVGVGKLLSKEAAKTLTPVCLELGGNDAMLVCDDADLHRAALGAVWAGFQNAGQSCGGVERIYVHTSVYTQFLSLLKQETESLRLGYDVDFNVDIGAMTTAGQVRTVKHHIKDALDKGAKIFAMANPPRNGVPDQFVAPVVLTQVTHEMLVMKEETFGPVISVMAVDTMEEAVELANDSTLGLTCSVWSKNRKTAESLARRIKTGVAMINDHLMSHALAETPWGGPKETGGGRTHGEIGFAEMTYPQVIVHEYAPGIIRRNLWWPPYSKTLFEGIKGATRLFYGKGFTDRLAGSMRLLVILPRLFKGVGKK